MARHTSAVFSCSFARRTCLHDSLFHDAYQRTNRTKGTKILRCFPHCCPRHVDRSYCGGPVYLQVDLVHGDAEPVEDSQLCAFAHFHPQAEDGLALGELVAREAFSPRKQQTDTNPEGEWIGARLVASADRTTWMFEVNPSGRWFYQWESGATKAQRSTEHLFEVYLLMVQPTVDEYKVVAKTCSPSFKMVSFRRAPVEKSVVAHANLLPPFAGDVAANAPSVQSFDDEEEKASNPPAEQLYRDSIDSAASTDTELASLTLTRSGIYDRTSYSPRPTDQGMERDSFTEVHGRPVDDVALAPLSLLPSTEVVMISRQLATLVELLHVLPATTLDAVRPIMERTLRSCVLSGQGRGRPSLAALIGPLSATREASSRDLPMSVYTALELALWILFDTELGRIQEHRLQHASMGLLDKVALYESYYSWLRDFHQNVNVHLEANQSGAPNLAGLAETARCWLDAHSVSPSQRSQECSGLEPFIAQAREVFLASSGIGASTTDRRSTKRPRAPEQATSLPQRPRQAPSLQALRVFVGSWQTDISSIQWHPVVLTPMSPSVFVMLWGWRQLLVFNIATEAVVPPGTSPTLAVSSYWNASASKTRCSRLVLDGKPRWLRVFPSGESTSSVFLGNQRLDHYIASFHNDHSELLANLYTWPVAQDLDETSCFCLRLSLRHQPASDGLRVRMAVERGLLRRGVDVVTLGENTLTHKLQAVDQWTTLHSIEYACHRQDLGNQPK